MPAVNVARTDTFEQQRIKINQIGDQIFNISAGGSDLSTGNLKLGDGTKDTPSLAFISNSTLGIFKSDTDEISFVSNGKDISSLKTDSAYFYQDFNVRKRNLLQSGIVIQDSGQNYDTGIYSNIDVIEGSGVGASFNFTVEAFGGVINNQGSNYLTGFYTDIPVSSTGSGTNVLVEFATFSPEIGISNPGSGYLDGEFFSIPAVSSGLGENLTVNLVFSGGSAVSVEVETAGSKHLIGDTFTFDNATLTAFDSETGEELTNSGIGLQLNITNNPNSVDPDSLIFTNKGEGHSVGDLLSLPSGTTNVVGDLPGILEGVSTTLSTASSTITVSSTSGILAGMDVSQVGGDGQLGDFTTVLSVDSSTQITLSETPSTDGTADLNFSSASLSSITLPSVSGIVSNSLISGGGYSGTVASIDSENNIISIFPDSTNAIENVTFSISQPYGSGAGFEYEIEEIGVVSEAIVSDVGNGYAIGDILTVRSTDLTQPITVYVNTYNGQEITVSSPIPVSVGDVINTYTPPDAEAGTPASYGVDLEVIEITSGSNGSASAFVASSEVSLSDGVEFVINSSGTVYTVDTAVAAFRYYLGFDENNLSLTPNLTLYVGNTYNFSQTDGSFSAHPIKFSPHPDGAFNVVQNITTTISTASKIISVADSSGILPKMLVSVSSGTGTLSLSTTVESVNGNNITLSEFPTSDGSPTLTFTGVALTDNVTASSGSTLITILETTDNPLYYYCNNHSGVGDQLTIDPNNPKVFGSGLQILINDIEITDIIKGKVSDGTFTFVRGVSTEIETETLSSSISISSPAANIDAVTSDSISSANSLNLSSPQNIVFSAQNLEYGTIILNSSNNSITTTGDINAPRFICDNKLTISGNNISSSSGQDILLTPFSGRVSKVDSFTAFTIPAGDVSERPTTPLAENGSIRFNTETNQYEGYSETNSSWSSLGGVRDLDGNTFILAEQSVGANDNTLWFYNDNIVTVRFTPTHFEFLNQKSIRSANVSAPAYINWSANSPVTLGQYLKYKNNLYEVTQSGTTATSGSEPTHTSGAQPNGTSELTYSQLAVAPLVFEDIEELRIGPLGSLPLSINSDLRLADNVISTDINDLLVRPNSGKKVVIDANSTLAIPVGSTADRGIPVQGSIRFNTDASQYEGYDGANWGSLGGVKDVDQNTYIIPESAPGANENILYFYNDGTNTMQLTTNALDFLSVDTIRSQVSGEFEITANLMTFNNAETTLDNTVNDTTFLHTSKQFFDIGLSAGLTVDPVLRLDNQGDVFLNIGFGTGVYDGVKIFDSDLKEFELADLKILSEKLTLVAGTINNAGSNIFEIATQNGAKVVVVAENTTTNAKEFFEFGVIDDGTDIFHTQYGNIRTDIELVTPTFERTGSGFARINFGIGSGVTAGENVVITIVSNVTKK